MAIDGGRIVTEIRKNNNNMDFNFSIITSFMLNR